MKIPALTMTDDPDDIDAIAVDVSEADDGMRLDRFLAAHCEDLSRSRLKALILEGAVTCGERVLNSPSGKVKSGDAITVLCPPPVDYEPKAENIPLDICFEDDDIVVLNKEAGMVVHPAPGHYSGTLVHALLYHCGDSLSGIGGVKRPGIVHRLDQHTSGVMIVAKSDKAHQGLAAQLADRTLSRQYSALIWGKPTTRKGTVDQPIGRHPTNRKKMAVQQRNSREARTHYDVVESYGEAASLVRCTLDTGRTHQIRVHMQYMKHPIVGDPVYGLQNTGARALLKSLNLGEADRDLILNFERQALHAHKLVFVHPLSQKSMEFEAPIPDDMARLIASFQNF